MESYAPSVRSQPLQSRIGGLVDEKEEVDLGWVTTNRRAPQVKSSAILSEDEDESASDEDEDDDVDGMGETEVDVKRAEQKRVEKDLQREANVSRSVSRVRFGSSGSLNIELSLSLRYPVPNWFRSPTAATPPSPPPRASTTSQTSDPIEIRLDADRTAKADDGQGRRHQEEGRREDRPAEFKKGTDGQGGQEGRQWR